MGEALSPPAADQTTEPVRRGRLDALWFALLIVAVLTGIGMTIFAPV